MEIRKFDNVDLWFIDTEGQPLPNPDYCPTREEWEACPGTLYQVYETPEDALAAARWWGY